MDAEGTHDFNFYSEFCIRCGTSRQEQVEAGVNACSLYGQNVRSFSEMMARRRVHQLCDEVKRYVHSGAPE